MKALMSFGIPFFLKIVIPGGVGASCLIPLMIYVAIKVGEYSSTRIALGFIVSALVVGFVISFLDHTIYRIYEGYLCWPNCIRKYSVERVKKKIGKKHARYLASKDQIEKAILMEWLTRFPFKEKRKGGDEEPQAVLPTMLGNILASYEGYPESRYGISGVFFWPRFWLTLDSETRKEINAVWAEADCVTYTSFVLICMSGVYVIASCLDLFNIPTWLLGNIFDPVVIKKVPIIANHIPLILLGVGLVLAVLSRAFYKISLPLHRKNGSYFESVFDIHRNRVNDFLTIYESDKVNWKDRWAYLRYYLMRCDTCKKFYPSELVECPDPECKKTPGV